MDLLSESIKDRLLFAIPKKGIPILTILNDKIDCVVGRLYDKCVELLRGALCCPQAEHPP